MMTFTIDRQGQSVDISIRPAEASSGPGRIGVQLAATAQLSTQNLPGLHSMQDPRSQDDDS